MLLAVSTCLVAQPISDTLELSLAEVKALRAASPMAGVVEISDTSLRLSSSAPALSDVLQQLTPYAVRIYGTGGVATLAYRGSAAHHSEVLWNGVPLNSGFLGMSDLSMMVLATGDILRIGQDGAPSVLPGALLQLQSSLPDSGEHKVDMDLTGGSFGSLNASAHLAAGGKLLHLFVRNPEFLEDAGGRKAGLLEVAGQRLADLPAGAVSQLKRGVPPVAGFAPGHHRAGAGLHHGHRDRPAVRVENAGHAHLASDYSKSHLLIPKKKRRSQRVLPSLTAIRIF
ncbi:MAG TPA: hypothetical protein P5550_12610 [Bacteroidales bacterium]|nr:hypothetical protein [Bacteroidales bacterium]